MGDKILVAVRASDTQLTLHQPSWADVAKCVCHFTPADAHHAVV